MFFPKSYQMCTFFCLTWNHNFSAGYTCFLVGLFFYGGGFTHDFGPLQADKFLGNISLKKNTRLEIANLLSCGHVSEHSNGRQLCTFLGFVSCLACRRRKKNFEGVCFVLKSYQLYTFLEVPFAASYTHFGI